ncbi:hypothetical protein RHGRI_022016 [Rhododendron griersonianum]|uniref:Uncharacterized protein n=1 Tax=Rhododendron griersonianum TaxID=479676 RepID=A0AAV6JSC4_9ERIC|nr:hypothetical protein RHGRI_022016 [Rhododendron griersonianum]
MEVVVVMWCGVVGCGGDGPVVWVVGPLVVYTYWYCMVPGGGWWWKNSETEKGDGEEMTGRRGRVRSGKTIKQGRSAPIHQSDCELCSCYKSLDWISFGGESGVQIEDMVCAFCFSRNNWDWGLFLQVGTTESTMGLPKALTERLIMEAL